MTVPVDVPSSVWEAGDCAGGCSLLVLGKLVVVLAPMFGKLVVLVPLVFGKLVVVLAPLTSECSERGMLLTKMWWQPPQRCGSSSLLFSDDLQVVAWVAPW